MSGQFLSDVCDQQFKNLEVAIVRAQQAAKKKKDAAKRAAQQATLVTCPTSCA